MRIRSIKPAFWTSRTIAKLDPWERLLFVGLWSYADDEGRGLADPTLIRAAIFPLEKDFEDADVDRMLASLVRERLVRVYRATPRDQRAAVRVLAVVHWTEHQRVDHPRESRYPGPPKRTRSSRAPRERLAKPRAGVGSKDKEEVDGAREDREDGAGSTPNGAGAYDPDRVGPAPYDVPIPGVLEDPELEPTSEEPTEPKPPPSRWRDPDWNPWSEVPPGKTIADLEELES